jgi:hypothetical protein
MIGRLRYSTQPAFFALDSVRGTLMKRLLACFLAVALPLALLGCGGSDKDKGINSNKDKPRADKNSG